MNTSVEITISVLLLICFDMYLKVELLGLLLILCITFERTAQLFSIVAAPFYIPISSAQRVQFLYSLSNTSNFPFFWIKANLMGVK